MGYIDAVLGCQSLLEQLMKNRFIQSLNLRSEDRKRLIADCLGESFPLPSRLQTGLIFTAEKTRSPIVFTEVQPVISLVSHDGLTAQVSSSPATFVTKTGFSQFGIRARTAFLEGPSLVLCLHFIPAGAA